MRPRDVSACALSQQLHNSYITVHAYRSVREVRQEVMSHGKEFESGMWTPPMSKSQVVCDRLSSGFLYLFACRATKYPKKDARFQSFKPTLAFQFVNQPFYCPTKMKGVPSGKIPHTFTVPCKIFICFSRELESQAL